MKMMAAAALALLGLLIGSGEALALYRSPVRGCARHSTAMMAPPPPRPPRPPPNSQPTPPPPSKKETSAVSSFSAPSSAQGLSMKPPAAKRPPQSIYKTIRVVLGVSILVVAGYFADMPSFTPEWSLLAVAATQRWQTALAAALAAMSALNTAATGAASATGAGAVGAWASSSAALGAAATTVVTAAAASGASVSAAWSSSSAAMFSAAAATSVASSVATSVRAVAARWRWPYSAGALGMAVVLLAAIANALAPRTRAAPRATVSSLAPPASSNQAPPGAAAAKPYKVISSPLMNKPSTAAAPPKASPMAPPKNAPKAPPKAPTKAPPAPAASPNAPTMFRPAASGPGATAARNASMNSKPFTPVIAEHKVYTPPSTPAFPTAQATGPASGPPAPPAAASMGTRATDVLLNDIIDIKRMFEKIDSDLVASLIAPKLYPVIDQVMVKDVRAVRTAKGIPAVPVVYEVVLRARTQVVVRKVIDRVKEDPTSFIDFKSLVASEVAVHDTLVKSISRRSQRFAVVSGLLAAVTASVVQLCTWLALDLRWSVAAGAAGVLTEGLFLRQQEEVMTGFAELLTAKLLSPQRLWKELTHGPKSSALVAVISQELRNEFSLLIYNTANGGNYREFAGKIREALPDAATPSYRHLETVLNVNGYLRTALRRISAGFEQMYGI